MSDEGVPALPYGIIPEVAGLELTGAYAVLAEAGYQRIQEGPDWLSTEPDGRVTGSRPPMGTDYNPGYLIEIFVSKGPQTPEHYTPPEVPIWVSE
jgi:beta-lactam-binding protein with PASTA domain